MKVNEKLKFEKWYEEVDTDDDGGYRENTMR